MIYESYSLWIAYHLRVLGSRITSPRPVRLVQLVRVVKQWFTSRTVCELNIIRGTKAYVYRSTTRTTRTIRTSRETMVYESYSLWIAYHLRVLGSRITSPRPVRLVQLVRVVKQWFTSRTVCELHIIRGTWAYIQLHDPYDRVVKQWFTGRTVCELYFIRVT